MTKLASICQRCQEQLIPSPNRCLFCGLPLTANRNCIICRSKYTPIDRFQSAFLYREPLPSLINLWKFQNRPDLTHLIASLAANPLQTLLLNADLVVPMPTHRRRQLWRGFDHIWLLSNVLCRQLQRSPPTPVLKQVHWRPQQSKINRSLRRSNGHIFEAKKSLSNQTVALVDDIATTGATALAAASALKNAGALSVALVTITSA
ncbi:MAG: hypothetical protein L7S45_03820 [Luminiphilus sp.]|nr:hypothetical protein [Luminiphilus sp.]